MAYSEEIKKKVLDELEKGKTVAELAKKHDISAGTIYNWRKKIAGATTIQKEFTKVNKRGKKSYSEEIKKQVLSDIEAGKKVSEVARENKISVTTIYNWKKTIKGAKTLDNKFTKPTEEEKRVSINMKMLINRGRYEEAEKIGKKFPDYPTIQSQMITIYMRKRKIQEAREIGKKFPDEPAIQSQMATIYMKEGKIEEAKEIGKKFPYYPGIQSQMLTIYMWEGKLEEAKNIGKKFSNYRAIQSQMITIYMKEGNIEEAKKIGEKFPTYVGIQSQMITIYTIEGKLEEAKKIGEKFPNYPAIQSQMLTICIKEGKIEEAKEIGKKFPNDQGIQSQMITIYMKEGNIEEAKKIGEKFPTYVGIQSQMITIYTIEGKLEKAKKIGKKFPNYPVIQTQIARILGRKTQEKQSEKSTEAMHEEENKIEEKHTENRIMQTPKFKILKEILNRMYNNPNDQTILEDINNLDEKWLKLILNSALGEKTNIKNPAQQCIKKLKKQGHVDEEHAAIINALDKRLKQNARIFDRWFYLDLICEVMKQEGLENKGTVDTQEGRE